MWVRPYFGDSWPSSTRPRSSVSRPSGLAAVGTRPSPKATRYYVLWQDADGQYHELDAAYRMRVRMAAFTASDQDTGLSNGNTVDDVLNTIRARLPQTVP